MEMVKALMAYEMTVAESAVQKEIHPQISQIEKAIGEKLRRLFLLLFSWGERIIWTYSVIQVCAV